MGDIVDLFHHEPSHGPTLLPCWRCRTQTTGRDHRGINGECAACRYEDDARPDDRTTSRQAAASTRRGWRSPMAKRILAELERRGTHGATDDELHRSALAGELLGSVSKRRGDLVAAGLVVDSGRTRPTLRGREAVVWVASTFHSFGGDAA